MASSQGRHGISICQPLRRGACCPLRASPDVPLPVLMPFTSLSTSCSRKFSNKVCFIFARPSPITSRLWHTLAQIDLHTMITLLSPIYKRMYTVVVRMEPILQPINNIFSTMGDCCRWFALVRELRNTLRIFTFNSARVMEPEEPTSWRSAVWSGSGIETRRALFSFLVP